ncbi:MAG: TonB C-terminal domain-containing protein [Rhodocyclales bacterium]|nr:TonB C-terminal domain-containing protein [Rhodocyclales bacterium]
MSPSPLDRPENLAGKYVSLALAIAVHLVLAAVLFYGVRWQTQATDVVEVDLVRAVPINAAVPPAPTFEPPPEPKPAPRAESRPTPVKPDIVEKAEPKPKPEPKPEPEFKPRLNAFLDQLKQETQRLIQRKNTDAATADLEKEKAAREATARAKATADYLSRIRGKIRGNIVLPPGLQGNPEAVFAVAQLPSGEIISVRLKHSSGNVALDAAIERAIQKSSPLPKPEQADVFSRDLELKFRPLAD